jgi:DNA-binding transcriptional LysR family regulator
VPVQVVDNITTALGIAAAGLGFTCSPAYVRVLAEPMGLAMRAIIDPPILRYMSLYTPAQRKMTRAALDFADLIQTRLIPNADSAMAPA